jgi:integrase
MPVVDAYEDVGLTFEPREGGRFILRWRQNEEQPDGSVKRVQRTKMTFNAQERRRFEDVIGQALRTKGYWSADDVGEAVARPAAVNMELAAADWVTWKVGTKGAVANTRAANAGSMARFFRAMRAVTGIAADAAVPATVMTLANIDRVVAQLRTEHVISTLHHTMTDVAAMWAWVADDTERYPGVPRPPFSKDRILPEAPSWEAPEAVATWAEADACVRRIRLPYPRIAATIMRYTGLRVEQVAMVHREDFNLDEASPTLLIRKGKSRREKALMRRVPISKHLIEDLGDWLRAHPGGPLFPDANDPSVPMKSYRNMTRYVTEAWRAATKADEARQEVWSPPNRAQNRPDHAFRSALQGALDDAGFSETILDWLVGHAPKTTRGRHYKRPSDEAVRRAVLAIPPIEWKGEAAIVTELRGRGAGRARMLGRTPLRLVS